MRHHNQTLALASILALSMAACVPGLGPVGDGNDTVPCTGNCEPSDTVPCAAGDCVDSDPTTCEAPVDFAESYAAHGTWSFTGPVNEQRSLGDLVSDAVTEELVSVLGVPGFLQDKARAKLRDLVGDNIKNAVDNSDTAQLISNSDLYAAIESASADIIVTSDITIDQDKDGTVHGREEIRSVEISGTEFSTTIDETSFVAATWSATVDGDTLHVAPHPFEIPLGDLMVDYIESSLIDEASSLESEIAAAVCDPVRTAILGADGKLTLDIGIYDYDITGAVVDSACDAAAGLAVDMLIDTFNIDTHVEVGGTIALEGDCTGAITGLESGADYGGIVTVLPEFIAPRVIVSFSAN